MSTELNHNVCRPVRTEEQPKTNYKALEMQRTQSPSKHFTSVFNNSQSQTTAHTELQIQVCIQTGMRTMFSGSETKNNLIR